MCIFRKDIETNIMKYFSHLYTDFENIIDSQENADIVQEQCKKKTLSRK